MRLRLKWGGILGRIKCPALVRREISRSLFDLDGRNLAVISTRTQLWLALTSTYFATKSQWSKCWAKLASSQRMRMATNSMGHALCMAQRRPRVERFRSTSVPAGTIATNATAKETNSSSGQLSISRPFMKRPWTSVAPWRVTSLG